MRAIWLLIPVVLGAVLLCLASPARAAGPQKKEYLSETEADKIRDAGTSGPRIGLYATFAADRIKKIKYELAHVDAADRRHSERLNSLINGYTGCIDDAADLLKQGIEKQEDIREGLKELQTQIKALLPYLQSLASSGPERETYKDSLDDAIEATQDVSKEIEKAVKEMAPPPVRRKAS